MRHQFQGNAKGLDVGRDRNTEVSNVLDSSVVAFVFPVCGFGVLDFAEELLQEPLFVVCEHRGLPPSASEYDDC